MASHDSFREQLSEHSFYEAIVAMLTAKVGVLGAGVTGVRVVEHLRALGHTNILVSDKTRARAQRLSSLHSTNEVRVAAVAREELFECGVVVLAIGSPHAHMSTQFIQRGVSVVSLSDNVQDCMNLLALDAQAKELRNRLESERGYRFKRAPMFASGYDRRAVDLCLDRVLIYLNGHAPLTAVEVRDTVFPTQHRGYSEDQVDAFLDAVVSFILASR